MNRPIDASSLELAAAKTYLINHQRSQALAPLSNYPRYFAAASVILYMVPFPLLGPLTGTLCFFGLGAALSVEIFALRTRVSLLQSQIAQGPQESLTGAKK
jgi:hypothetical protein